MASRAAHADADGLVVVGAGPVGLVTAAGLASLGHRVAVVESNPERLAALQTGRVPFHEPGLSELVAAGRKAKLLTFGTDPAVASGATAAFICVGTPPGKDGAADLSFVRTVAANLAPHLPRGATVVLRSTVPPGTGDEVEALLRDAGRTDLAVVNAPEFLAEGTAVKDFQAPERLLAGGAPEAAQRVLALFDGLPRAVPRIATDRRSAEVAKYAANAFLAARISLINEVANLCDAVGADVRDVARVVGLDSRVGAKFLRPGLGYGGSCFPKDVQALAAVGRQAGIAMPLTTTVHAGNEAQWRHVADRLLARLGKPKGKRVAVLGIAFKPGTDDTREAPSLKAQAYLLSKDVAIAAHDPLARLPIGSKAVHASSAAEAIAGADAVLLATEWPEYAKLPWAALRATMKGALVVDARNHLAGLDLPRLGFDYLGVGVPAREAAA